MNKKSNMNQLIGIDFKSTSPTSIVDSPTSMVESPTSMVEYKSESPVKVQEPIPEEIKEAKTIKNSLNQEKDILKLKGLLIHYSTSYFYKTI
jgi:hypothetical protein